MKSDRRSLLRAIIYRSIVIAGHPVKIISGDRRVEKESLTDDQQSRLIDRFCAQQRPPVALHSKDSDDLREAGYHVAYPLRSRKIETRACC